MSQSSRTENTHTKVFTENREERRPRVVSGHAPRAALSSLRMIGFWVAITVPFFYLPLLGTGLETSAEIMTFCGLVAVNVLALVAGHNHRK